MRGPGYISIAVVALACLPALFGQRIEQAGVTLDFRLHPMAGGEKLRTGDLSELVLKATDSRSGEPVSGVHAQAWMLTRSSHPNAVDYSCEDKVRPLLLTHMGTRADVNFNGYLLLALNADRTISFVNPLANYPDGKTENVIALPGDAYDWAVTPDRKNLLVTIPSQHLVLVIDTNIRRIVASIQTGEAGKPARIAVQADSRIAWIGLDNAAAVLPVDLDHLVALAAVTTGAGKHQLAFAPHDDLLYISNDSGGSVSVIRPSSRRKLMDIAIAGEPGPIAFDPASRSLFVASVVSGEISMLLPGRQKAVRQIKLQPGASAIGFPPNGRFAWVVNPGAGDVSIIDAATMETIECLQVPERPTQIHFTDEYAYIYRSSSGNFSLVPTGLLTKETRPRQTIAAQELVLSQTNHPALRSDIAASHMATAPTREWVFFANSADRTLPQYGDGIRAAITPVGNENRAPIAVLVLDRSLDETLPGVYRTNVMLHWGGSFDVPVLVDNVQHCFRVEVDGRIDPDAEKKRPRFAAPQIRNAEHLVTGQSVRLKMPLEDLSGRPIVKISDFKVLIYERPGIHQQWIRAVDSGNGVYDVPVRFDVPGTYTVFLSSRSQGAAVPVPIAKLTVQGEKQ